MVARLVIIIAFVSAAAVLGVLAYGSGLLLSGAVTTHPRAASPDPEFRVATLAWPAGALGLTATTRLVIWPQRGARKATRGLWAYHVQTRRVSRLLGPRVVGSLVGRLNSSGSTVVWARTGPRHAGTVAVQGYDGATRRCFDVASDGRLPCVSGHIVVWVSRSAPGAPPQDALNGLDTVTGERFSLPVDGRAREAATWGPWVAWTAGPAGAAAVWTAGRRSTDVYQLAPAGWDVAIDHERVVWAARLAGRRSAIVSWNRHARHSHVLWQVPTRVSDLALGREFIVWRQDTGRGDIWAYDLAGGDAFPVCADPAPQADPVLVGRTVFWADRRSGRWELYGRTLQP